MSTSRLLPFSRQLLTKNILTLKKNVGESARGSHVVCVPPRNRIPFGEKVAMGIVIALSMWALPAWIMYHIPEYQKEDRNVYSGK